MKLADTFWGTGLRDRLCTENLARIELMMKSGHACGDDHADPAETITIASATTSIAEHLIGFRRDCREAVFLCAGAFLPCLREPRASGTPPKVVIAADWLAAEINEYTA
jgi:hypothetical protein